MASYVLFNEHGDLIGGFFQVPPPEHTEIIFVDDEVRLNWPLYRANEARDGVEIAQVRPTPLDAQAKRAAAKAARDLAVAAIVVTVDGMPFDGDEQSQQRMSRAAQALSFNGVPFDAPAIKWTLADNSVELVSAKQLIAAMTDAGQRQSDLWHIDDDE